MSVLALAYSEHLSPAYRAHTLSRRLPILHGYAPGVPHFPLGPAFYTVCLHLITSLFACRIDYSLPNVKTLARLHFIVGGNCYSQKQGTCRGKNKLKRPWTCVWLPTTKLPAN